MASLRVLDFCLSRLPTFPLECCKIAELRELRLSNNEIGEIPAQITSLSQLRVLELTHNKIREIPEFINKLAYLRVFTIDHNQLEEIPEAIVGLIHLEVFNAGHNALTDISKLNMSQMHNMRELHFDHNQLTAFNHHVGQMRQLEVINLENNLIKSMPREIGWLGKTLRALLLARNKIVRLPGDIVFLNPTVKLTLEENPLVDPFNMLLNNMKTLTHIRPFCMTYLKAFPNNCVALGDAVMESQAGVGTKFTIEARDFEGNHRVNGKDKFKVCFIDEKADPESVKDATNFAIVKDLDDGTYQVAFNNRVAGVFKLHIFNEDVHIRNSPFTHVVKPGMINPTNCGVEGPGITSPQSGVINSFTIIPRDQFNNQQVTGGEAFSVSIAGGNNPIPFVVDLNNGLYEVQWTPAWPDRYEISIGWSGYHILGSPFQVVVAQ